jgi:hypothetical protein
MKKSLQIFAAFIGSLAVAWGIAYLRAKGDSFALSVSFTVFNLSLLTIFWRRRPSLITGAIGLVGINFIWIIFAYAMLFSAACAAGNCL